MESASDPPSHPAATNQTIIIIPITQLNVPRSGSIIQEDDTAAGEGLNRPRTITLHLLCVITSSDQNVMHVLLEI